MEEEGGTRRRLEEENEERGDRNEDASANRSEQELEEWESEKWRVKRRQPLVLKVTRRSSRSHAATQHRNWPRQIRCWMN